MNERETNWSKLTVAGVLLGLFAYGLLGLLSRFG
jgi:hypothetical protein